MITTPVCTAVFTVTDAGGLPSHDWVMIERNVTAADAMRILGGGNNSSPELVATYDYTDESGNLLYQTCRYQPKDFRQRRPDGKGGWINNLQGVRRVLYRLPEVLKAQTVCVPEGEKDCDNLAKFGFVATTNPLGAGKWRDEYSETLRGKDVIVFGDVGDDDGAGEKHTQHSDRVADRQSEVNQTCRAAGWIP